ncbi:hypothetical protein A3B57_00835 [Microgenomates group bacterium RIFCSPLOWO2_01_FULL_47_10]|nr:MAG: hypothetical protein A3B57_00835 [Microgenomates group bacterium RIFCSPLOWO2_01_FULL_47_10]
MSETSILGAELSPLLTRLAADETGGLEMEIRFGEIHKGKRAYFQTGVSLNWLMAVKAYLERSGWILISDIKYQQFKVGQKRVRIFADGKTEAISKRVIAMRDVMLPKAKDVRISLAREKAVDIPSLTGVKHKRVYRQTYMLDGFRFDLTKTKHPRGKLWENRVEVEVVDGLQANLRQIIETVAAIS